jgi:hypothetical protein
LWNSLRRGGHPAVLCLGGLATVALDWRSRWRLWRRVRPLRRWMEDGG